MSRISVIFETWKDNLNHKGMADEYEAKDLLSKAGLPVPLQYRISPEEALSPVIDFLPAEMTAPYVVKLCSPKVLHKTELNAVRLGIAEDDLSSVLKELARDFPGENLLIYHMEDVKGPEFILGALKDPSFGAAVMVGAGGVMTELYKDISFCLAPCSESDAEHLLSDLSISPVLEGFRGSRMDKEELIRIICDFSVLAAHVAESGIQLDVNPLVWNGKNWTVLDGKCVFVS